MSNPTRAVAGAVLTAFALAALTVPALAGPRRTTTTTTSTTTSTTRETTSTTSTSAPRSTTTTTTAAGATSSSTTSTTRAGGPTSTSSTSLPGATTTTTVDVESLEPGEIPPEVQSMIDAYPRTPSGSTDELVDALTGLPPRAALAGFGRFPVAGRARWSHDWLFPRHRPTFHVHEGTDVFADRGTLVLSPAAGAVRVTDGAVGGLAVYVTQPDGTYWYLAHLDEAHVGDGDEVGPGTVIGTVGDSGNARGGAPHVHIEVHPHGGEAHDPKQILDAYYVEALQRVSALVDAFEERARLRADRLEPIPPIDEPPTAVAPPADRRPSILDRLRDGLLRTGLRPIRRAA